MITVAQLQHEAQTSRDPDRLHDLAKHKTGLVRWAVTQNSHARDETIGQLLDDADANIRIHAASMVASRPALYARAIESPHAVVRASLASAFARRLQGSLPYEIQRRLAHDESHQPRESLAETTNYVDLFEQLLGDEHRKVRGWCAANPRITLEQMERLVTDRSSIVRRLSATLGMQFPTDEQLVRLARDKSKEVRWAVLFRPDRPREAVEIIAKDTDEMNRQHAELALRDDTWILARGVSTSAREEQRRAAATAPFENPPR